MPFGIPFGPRRIHKDDAPDITIDWTEHCAAEGVTITASAWTVDVPAELTIAGQSYQGYVSVCRLNPVSAVEGKTYHLQNTITKSDGQKKAEHVIIVVVKDLVP